MRLTGRRWATAFAAAALAHAGVLAVGLWQASDPGAGATGPVAISVSLSQAGGAAASAATEMSGLPEAEVVAAVETAGSAPIEEAVRTEAPATAPPVGEPALTDEPAVPLPVRALDAETAAHAVALDDAAAVEATAQAPVSEAPEPETIAVSATAVEMPVVETASTDRPATPLPARSVDAETPTYPVAPNDAAAVSEAPQPRTIAVSALAVEMPTVETAASPSPEPAREAPPLPDTSETGAIAPAEAPAGPAPVETIETVIRQAENPGIPEPESTTVEVPETRTSAVADAVTYPPIEEAVSAPPARVASTRRPSDTIEDPAVEQVEPANDPDPPDAEAKLVEAVQATEDPQLQRPIAAAAVDPREDAAEAIASSPPSADSDADRSAPPSATGASARLRTVGIQAVHDEYLRKVLTRIARFKRYPREARRDGAVGRVMVRFTILPDGSLRSPQLTDSSGDSRLDRAALEMLSRASPFPPIPPGLGAGKLELSLPIEYSLSEKRRLF